jgi:hypothetical protein
MATGNVARDRAIRRLPATVQPSRQAGKMEGVIMPGIPGHSLRSQTPLRKNQVGYPKIKFFAMSSSAIQGGDSPGWFSDS